MRLIFSKLSKRERYILYITVAGIIAVFFDRVVLRQVMDKLNKLNREILVHEKKLQRSLYILSQEGLVTSEYQKYTRDVKQSHSDEEEKSKLLSEIEKLARKSGVFLADIKPSSTEEIGSYREYTVEIEIESKISYLTDFIYQLEKSPRLLRIKSFHLRPKKKKSQILKARMTITEILIMSEEVSSEDAS